MNKIKLFLIFLIIFLLIGGCIIQLVYVRTITDRLLPLAKQLASDILLSKWDKAEKSFLQLQRIWKNHSPMLYSLVKHCYIDSISIEIAALSADFYADNYQDLPAEAARLQEHISTLARTERVTFSNIL